MTGIPEDRSWTVGNFSLCGGIRTGDGFSLSLLKNPGRLGSWLEHAGDVKFSCAESGCTLSPGVLRKDFPVTEVHFPFPGQGRLTSRARIWAPVRENSLFVTTIALIFVEFTFSNTSAAGKEAKLLIDLSRFFSGSAVPPPGRLITDGIAESDRALCISGADSIESAAGVVTAAARVPAFGQKGLCCVISLFDSDSRYARIFFSAAEILGWALPLKKDLYRSTLRFRSRISLHPDPEPCRILRLYSLPAVVLTKAAADEKLLTMGYAELNQRDSYWTSWLHLLLFPDCERTMIQESLDAVGEDGKVPTCILPQIEREDDLDINAYFILRVLRSIEYHKDSRLALECFSTLIRAADWLVSRDVLNEGLPQQQSYWGDWKDVPGVEGRKYSPHTAFLFLAAMRAVSQLARRLGREETGRKYDRVFQSGLKRLRTSVAEGGLKDGPIYRQTWYDGRTDTTVLQDQVVGLLFDLIPREEADAFLDALQAGESERGIRESWPYQPDSFGYPGGSYHNGGIWPWLNFAHAWAYLLTGRQEEADSLVRKVGKATVLKSTGNPCEYIDAETGQLCGPPIQGWNACLFGALAFRQRVPGTGR